jgi:putative cardiolipin synthase
MPTAPDSTAMLLRLLATCGLLLLTACAALPPRGEVPESFALQEWRSTTLGRVASEAAFAHPGGLSGFQLLMQPEAALQTRLDLIARAEATLDVQYYIFEDDNVGAEILAALRRAAARGVRVRLLLDDLQLAGAGPQPQPGLEVRVFNPLPARRGGVAARVLLSLHEFRRVNHRMHNKLLVADNSFSVSGGRNIGVEYFMRGEAANFLDLDVLSVGAVVREQSSGFDRYWNSAQAWPLPPLQPNASVLEVLPAPVAEAASASLSQTNFIWAPARVLKDDPAKLAGATLKDRFARSVSAETLAMIESARERVVIVTPYFIPGDIGLAAMARARDRGVATIIVTNSLGATDEPLVHAAYGRYRQRMLELGVTLYEVSPTLSRRVPQWGNLGRSEGRLHAKFALVDNRWMYVGSMNMDGRSASLNTESGLLIDSPALVGRFLAGTGPERFNGAYELRLAPGGGLRWVEDGGARVHDTEPGAGLLHSLQGWLILPFLDEELL